MDFTPYLNRVGGISCAGYFQIEIWVCEQCVQGNLVEGANPLPAEEKSQPGVGGGQANSGRRLEEMKIGEQWRG